MLINSQSTVNTSFNFKLSTCQRPLTNKRYIKAKRKTNGPVSTLVRQNFL